MLISSGEEYLNLLWHLYVFVFWVLQVAAGYFRRSSLALLVSLLSTVRPKLSEAWVSLEVGLSCYWFLCKCVLCLSRSQLCSLWISNGCPADQQRATSSTGTLVYWSLWCSLLVSILGSPFFCLLECTSFIWLPVGGYAFIKRVIYIGGWKKSLDGEQNLLKLG